MQVFVSVVGFKILKIKVTVCIDLCNKVKYTYLSRNNARQHISVDRVGLRRLNGHLQGDVLLEVALGSLK